MRVGIGLRRNDYLFIIFTVEIIRSPIFFIQKAYNKFFYFSLSPMLKNISLSNINAGLVTVLVGYTSSAVLIYQAALACGAEASQISSWFLSLGIGMGLGSIVLSYWYRIPIVVAWSTPGAVMLIATANQYTPRDIAGAFIFAAILSIITGLTGVFNQLMKCISPSLASAMLAGMLLHFGLDIFNAMQHQIVLVGSMVLVYCISKQFSPRYVILLVLGVGIIIANQEHLFDFADVVFAKSALVWVSPSFAWPAMIGLGLPLFVIVMSAQNIPGMTIIKAHGYDINISPVLSFIGIINLILAPFGAFSINLAAISAAVCLGEESDHHPTHRYRSAMVAGVFYILFGLLGATIVSLIAIFPKEMILAVAGLALLGTFGNSLKLALSNEATFEPALFTFLISASGFNGLGINAPIWGLIVGSVSYGLMRQKNRSVA